MRLSGRWPFFFLLCVVAGGSCAAAPAQGTKQWTVSRFDEMSRGLPDGVSVRSDGRIEPGSRPVLLGEADNNYVWSVTSGADGSVYAGLGGSTAGSAAVLRIAPGGKTEKVFSGAELGVQAVREARDGSLYAATSPDGKVYRMPAQTGGAATPIFASADTAEKPRYVWDLAVAADGTVFVATGAPAAVYRITRGGKPEVLFRTADQHIRCLLLTPEGTLWAGSDGAGVIYRVDSRAKEAKPYAVYAADRREITALARDTDGWIYAAAVGAKSPNTLQPLPVTGNVGVTVTFVQPGSTNAAGQNTVVPEGSEIDRVDQGGTPERMLTLRDDVVYALVATQDGIVAATGNRGRLYRLDAGNKGLYTQIARVEASQATALATDGTGLVVGTSNAGKVYRLPRSPASISTYTSEVFDAGQVARWGRAEVEGTALPEDVKLQVRTGNVPNPIAAWGDWNDVASSAAAEAAVTPQAGRYAQWRAELKPGGAVRSVTLNYLPRNVAPIVDEVVVVPGARVTAQSNPGSNQTVQVVFPGANAAAQAISVVQDAQQPLTAQKDRAAVTVRWNAHDDNGDDLMFAVWYRGTGEQMWRLLKNKISDRFLSFDASLLPDGEYTVRVVASDAPVHVEGQSLSGERVSETFVVDSTPPVPGELRATLTPGPPQAIHATFEARDATSPIAHAEYSLDAGPWQYLEPVGSISDSRSERYDFTVSLPKEPDRSAKAATGEHVLAVRVYDRYENMASSKAVVR